MSPITPPGATRAGFNLSEWALNHRALVLYLILVVAAAGFIAYGRLGQSEDPPFTFKVMVVKTNWPGATAREVEQQVTDKIERKLQELPLEWVRSYSKPGESLVFVSFRDTTPSGDVPELQYQVRKKIGDIRQSLPSGIQGPYFNDEFGDTYTNVYAITGDGFGYRELKEFGDRLRAELLRVPGVAKVDFVGEQEEKVFVELSNSKLATLGIEPATIFSTLAAQNAIAASGVFDTATDRIYLRPTGALDSLDAIRDITLRANNRVLRLGDIATVKRGYVDPPQQQMRFRGHEALGLGVTVIKGGDVIELGRDLDREVARVQAKLPVGVDIAPVASMPQAVQRSVNQFVRSLTEAVVIVLAVSLVSLGLRTGLVVAVSIPLVLAATFLGMWLLGIGLHKISLGALILSLGLLVDDAIIAVEMMAIKLEQGFDRFRAASFAYTSTAFPMLTGTLITVAGFLPIATAKSSTGEYTRSIFEVSALALVASGASGRPASARRQLVRGDDDGGAEARSDPRRGAGRRPLRHVCRQRQPALLPAARPAAHAVELRAGRARREEQRRARETAHAVVDAVRRGLSPIARSHFAARERSAGRISGAVPRIGRRHTDRTQDCARGRERHAKRPGNRGRPVRLGRADEGGAPRHRPEQGARARLHIAGYRGVPAELGVGLHGDAIPRRRQAHRCRAARLRRRARAAVFAVRSRAADEERQGRADHADRRGQVRARRRHRLAARPAADGDGTLRRSRQCAGSRRDGADQSEARCGPRGSTARLSCRGGRRDRGFGARPEVDRRRRSAARDRRADAVDDPAAELRAHRDGRADGAARIDRRHRRAACVRQAVRLRRAARQDRAVRHHHAQFGDPRRPDRQGHRSGCLAMGRDRRRDGASLPADRADRRGGRDGPDPARAQRLLRTDGGRDDGRHRRRDGVDARVPAGTLRGVVPRATRGGRRSAGVCIACRSREGRDPVSLERKTLDSRLRGNDMCAFARTTPSRARRLQVKCDLCAASFARHADRSHSRDRRRIESRPHRRARR